MSEKFFEARTEESRVKAEIVDKYYRAWSRIIAPRAKEGRVAYVDLFCGPGRYKDGSASVPILVIENAIQDPILRERLVTIFNDRDENNTQTLQNEVANIPGIEGLKFQPQIMCEPVGEKIIAELTGRSLIPTLSFIDPWGYKGLSLKLINTFIRDWGCDCIFFFNYNRINMGLHNPIVKSHMDSLFGEERADDLRRAMQNLSPAKRELLIVEKITAALKEMGGVYVLPFCFKNETGKRTSHYLIFISKAEVGYTIMKDVMGGASSSSPQGVPSFSYCEADVDTPLLFELSRPLDDLQGMLLDEFSGKTMRMIDVFHRHHVDKPYIKRNYKEALLSLESEGKIAAEPSKRRANTFGDDVRVTFPR